MSEKGNVKMTMMKEMTANTMEQPPPPPTSTSLVISTGEWSGSLCALSSLPLGELGWATINRHSHRARHTKLTLASSSSCTCTSKIKCVRYTIEFIQTGFLNANHSRSVFANTMNIILRYVNYAWTTCMHFKWYMYTWA